MTTIRPRLIPATESIKMSEDPFVLCVRIQLDQDQITMSKKEAARVVLVVAANGYDVLINDLNKLIQTERVFLAATSTVLAAQRKGYSKDGKSATEAQIGTYSTKPISISKVNSQEIRERPISKVVTGSTKKFDPVRDRHTWTCEIPIRCRWI